MKAANIRIACRGEWVLPCAVMLVCVCADRALTQDDVLPKKLDLTALEIIWKDSPYQRNVIAEGGPATSGAYALTGIVTIGSKCYVNVMNRATSERLTLSETPSTNNARVIDFHTNDNLKDVYATIEVEGVRHQVRYDQALLSTAPVLPANAVPGNVQPTNNNVPFARPPWMNNFPSGGGMPRFNRRSRAIENPNASPTTNP